MQQVDLHERVKQVKPDLSCKPGTFLVAVLNDAKLPQEITQQTDLLWIKCPGRTTLTKIRDSYRTAQGYPTSVEIVLAYESVILPNLSLPISLINKQEDSIIAIEAIKPSQVLRRKHLKTSGRSSHSEATKLSSEVQQPGTRARSIGESVSPDSDRGTKNFDRPSMIPGSQALHDDSTIAPQKGQLHHSSPSSEHSHKHIEQEALASGYLDFVCERRSLGTPEPGSDDFAAYTLTIEDEWRRLSQTEIENYSTRGARIHALTFPDGKKSPPMHSNSVQSFRRAFWQFHRERQLFYQQRDIGGHWHKDPEGQRKLLTDVCFAWTAGNDDVQIRSISSISLELQKEPIQFPPPTRNGHRPNKSKDRTKGMAELQVAEENQHASSPLPSVETSFSPCAPEASAFSEDLLQVPSSQPQQQPINVQIPHLFTGASPEVLEQGLVKGVEILQSLKEAFTNPSVANNSESVQWLSSIENVQRLAKRTATIVGVVGNTGAGKSSVINAMLDEERLVPTNCMRACTAVVTEISYNYGDDPYRAEIEFISAEDWRKELKILFKDLLDGNGAVSRECTDESSEAGIAYAKIKAVYPKMTKEVMAGSSIDRLMQHNNVANLLGANKKFAEENASSFYKRLQFYVDSKEKSTGDKKEKKPREMEFWPLIKVVRLYVKSPALSTGAVVVDLPGVHDSNQARAAVAEGYMKSCTGLWIVAPITRAVDDKAAKSLLGDSFKRQLKMDGGFSSVTFICSKTDDISITEAAESLGLENQLGSWWEEYDRLEKQINDRKARIKELKGDAEDAIAAMNTAEDEIEIWEDLQERFEAGETVYAPRRSSKKRKHSRGPSDKPRKKRKHNYKEDSDDDFIDDGVSASISASDNGSETESEEEPKPLGEEQMSQKMAELKALKKEGRQAKSKLHEEMKPIRDDISQFEKQLAEVDAKIKRRCISGRNDYSKGAIQQDFAAGVKELDQEIAEEEDAANFDPEADRRDYDEVASSLPVFCVSSRAYQRLQGRFAKDSRVPGFTALDETEIPQLQAHCKKLTEAGRQAACRIFLNNLSSLINSLRFWSSNDGTGAHLSDDQKARESRLLNDKMRKLDTAVQSSFKSLCRSIRDELTNIIYDQFPAAISKATNDANKIAVHWGSTVNRQNRAEGGYYWASYKAICRREGVFSNAQGHHDWNDQLSQPMLAKIMNPWDKCFNRSIPNVLRNLPNNVADVLNTFQKDIESRAVRNGSSPAALQMLSQQLNNYKSAFRDMSDNIKSRILEESKEINRQFIPVVATAMQDAYSDCENEHGSGSFMRMKALMTRHVDSERHQMFAESCRAVKDALDKMMASVEEQMLLQGGGIFFNIKQDYTSALFGHQTVAGQQLPMEAKTLRCEVFETVEGAESVFKRVVGLDIGMKDEEIEMPFKSEETEDADLKDVEVKAEEVLEGSASPLQPKSRPEENENMFRPSASGRNQSHLTASLVEPNASAQTSASIFEDRPPTRDFHRASTTDTDVSDRYAQSALQTLADSKAELAGDKENIEPEDDGWFAKKPLWKQDTAMNDSESEEDAVSPHRSLG